jgi:hypothetical protein
MGKINLNVVLSVIVDTDLVSPDDIMDNLNINIVPESENVEVCQHEVENFQIANIK